MIAIDTIRDIYTTMILVYFVSIGIGFSILCIVMSVLGVTGLFLTYMVCLGLGLIILIIAIFTFYLVKVCK